MNDAIKGYAIEARKLNSPAPIDPDALEDDAEAQYDDMTAVAYRESSRAANAADYDLAYGDLSDYR